MKLRFFLTGVIFVFSGLVSRGQVVEALYQGFENGETSRVSATPTSSMAYSTTYHASGSRSLELSQSNTEDVTLYLDTLDFTNDLTIRYISLYFDHICKVPRDDGAYQMCAIYFKRPNQPDWTRVTNTYYNMTEGGSSAFSSLQYFNNNSYPEWEGNAPITNDIWKSERFDFNNVIIPSLAPEERKLMFKFVIRQKTSSGAATGKWLLDNVKVNASSEMMVRPKLKMAMYPDLYYHPNSRGARIELNATTTLAANIDPDSVYLIYRVGSDPTPVRVPMAQVTGRTNYFRCQIPFFGYDTLMAFYCVAKDATNNHNAARFPAQEGGWQEYACVRGVEQPGVERPGFVGTTSTADFPFPWYADNRSEWVFDSALMAEAGYKAGTITALRFTTGAHTNNVTRQQVRIMMKNVPTDYTVDTSVYESYPYTESYMHTVYDSALTIPERNVGGTFTIQLQDSFYYAGKDLVMQMAYHNPSDMTATSVKTISMCPGKPTIWITASEADYGRSGFTLTVPNKKSTRRPAIVITQRKNIPLLYDMGFVTDTASPEYGLVTPNHDVPMTPTDYSLQVRLKNWGALTANAIRISYSIDGTVNGYYDWSGTLAGGAVQMITIAPNVPLAAGFHTLRVWVEDSLTAGGQRYRDHEPYNDTVYSEFVVCEGPMHGVRYVGGTNRDFNTLEEFLYALSRCGVDDTLVVKLAAGQYKPATMLAFSGSSASNYVVFEPRTNNVTFYADATVPEAVATEILNLEQVSNVRFRNIKFVRRTATEDTTVLESMVRMGINTVNCRFEGCSFIDSVANPVATLRINSLVSSGYANGIIIDGCTFRGGKVGVDLRGIAEDALSQNNKVSRSLFYNQYESAINVQNQTNVVIEKNEMYDVLSNTSYVLLVSECYGASKFLANKIYTSHGAGAMGVSMAVGTSSQRILIANNMVVGNDDGSANLMRSPLNIIQASYTDVVYNSVKMTATTRSNIAAATLGGGSLLTNNRFLNNIVVCLDNLNYAFYYLPGTVTSNEVGHNVYYSMGTTMNRKGSAQAYDMDEWRVLEPADSLSVKVNPNFLNGSLVDLRTFNRQVKGIGIPLASVPVDMFDTLRGDSATCPGAYEFVSLGYDFEPEALVNPEASTCYMPLQTELVLRIRNNGTSVYTGSGLTVTYKVNNQAPVTVSVTDTIPADDTATIHTGALLSLPASGFNDVTYNIRVWTTYAADPNATNDTNVFTVVSKYHPAAPDDVDLLIDYATEASVTPVLGVNQWSVYTHTAAPQRPSTLYWYRDTLDADPFYVGPTLTTDTLRQDTTFWFRQRRAQPMVRITQLEIKHGGTGANAATGETPNAPYWLVANRKAALQLTNVGDAPACLYGDTIVTVSPTTNLNNKSYRFNDSIYIQPGQSLVVQFATGNSVSPANTVHTGTPLSGVQITASSNIAIQYKRNGVVEDAVVLGTVANHNSPSWVWTGGGVDLSGSTTTSGIVRTGFVGTMNDWRIATDANPMMLNSTDPNWIWYVDNGCEGEFATASVSMIAPPPADLDVSHVQLPASSCGLGLENVTVTVRNYGLQPVNGFVMNYTTGSDTVTEAFSDTLPNSAVRNVTFTAPLNLAFDHDTTLTVKVWVNAVTGDPIQSNDTSSATVLSRYTPSAPDTLANRIVEYATRDTVTITPMVEGLIPVWYDYYGNAVDTGYMGVSEILYVGGTRSVSWMVYDYHWGQIGTGTATNGNTAYPSPYQPGSKHAKQQYIYSASELKALGLEAGYIDSIAFDLQQMVGSTTSVNFIDYYVSMGLTSDTIFANTSDWKSTEVVMHRSPLTIQSSDCGQWKPLRFDRPFYWDGESSVVVQLVHYIDPKVTTGVKSAYTVKNNTTLHKNGDNALSPTTMDFVGAGTKGNNRPNIRLYNSVYGCESEATPYEVQLVNIPAVDMAIFWPDGVDTIEYNSCDSLEFYINLRNQGASVVDTMKVYYTIDAQAVDSVEVTTQMVPGVMNNVLLLKQPMMPGRHTLTVVTGADGDLIPGNDTISRMFAVRFCGGVYTIAPTGADYHAFGEAIDTLNAVGVEGPVTFNVGSGTYTEQVVLNTIPGASSANTIAFIGVGEDVKLTAATTAADNYVFFLDSASNVTLRNICIESRPTGNGASLPANALVMQKGANITVDSCTIRVKGNINNANASCVVLGDNISNLLFTNNVVDSGFYSIRTAGTGVGYNDVVLRNNVFHGFWMMGANLRGVTNLTVVGNRITSGVSTAGRSLRGLYLAQTAGDFLVDKNHIYLNDTKTGGKIGIQLENISCLGSNPGYVTNNMIGCTGTGVANLPSGMKPCGIWIDSSSSNINVVYNTVRIECGTVAASATFSENSYAFFTGATVNNIHVMNNIFSNFLKGYAYYVTELNTVTLSNFNAYYTESEHPFYWKQVKASLAELQAANSDDANSVVDQPFFISNEDLHLVMINFVTLAQYTTEVTDDIDGTIRSQIPAPTIGAHEMSVCTHDLAVIEILSPTVPGDTNFRYPDKMPPNIEGDSVWVKARFFNNGRSLENGVQWYAYLEGYESITRTPNRNLGTFNPSQMKIDSVLMPTELGIINRQKIHVVLTAGANECSPEDNDRVGDVYLAPAYDFKADGTSTMSTEGCYRQNTTLQITVKNAGFKDIPAGTQLTIGFLPQITQPAGTVVSTMPGVSEGTVTLPTALLCNQTVLLSLPYTVNLYPTGLYTDLQVRIRGWVHHDLDVSPGNDTTAGSVVPSYYTPAPPVGYDTTLAYGTWGAVRASQENTRPIRWYRDVGSDPYYSPSQYAASCRWTNTPQYFHDSTYYLNCLSSHNCASDYSPVTVHVAARIPNDMAMKQVLAPLGDRVYMENDTVRVVISNYGTSSQTNIPITYQLKRGNTVVQTETEICNATIPAGQDYTYTFSHLLNITTPTSAQNYSLNIWTDLATDGTRRNDTLRTPHLFHSLPESTYDPQCSSNPSFDVTRVSYNEIDFDLPPLGRGLTDLASYAAPDYPVLHVTRGTTDSLIIGVMPLDASQLRNRYNAWAYIDFDRSGTFTADEKVVNGVTFYDEQLCVNQVTIPQTASYGYMRMRIAVGSYNSTNITGFDPVGGIPADKDGHTLEFLLFVDEEVPTHDIAVTQVVAPRSYLISDDLPKTVSFRIANKGSMSVTQPQFHYRFIDSQNDSASGGYISYNGTLEPGASAVVSLPEHVFPFGTTVLNISYESEEDTIMENNMLVYEYNRFHIITLTLDDDFEGENIWYAPTGYNAYSHNYWERGYPTKSKLNAPYSDSNAWVTDLNSSIVSGKRGNVSYLYSPIINIAHIKVDTISFYLRRNLTNGSTLHVEFFNGDRRWVKLETDSANAWYNNTEEEVFDGTTPGSSYGYFWVPCWGSRISGDFPEKLQFRLVYTTPMGSTNTSAFGEGCAIDNFRIGRAPIRNDAGVVAITYPTAPSYGQTIFPEVVVENFGLDTIREATIGYTHYGTYMPKMSTVSCLIAPGETDTIALTSSFLITSDFPDTFYINAFTKIDGDIFRDNDSISVAFPLAPLANDIAAHEFIYPLDRVIAGDTNIQVTIRIRNFGENLIHHAVATYIVNSGERVDEDINFEDYLGRPFESMEYFNYTFRQRIRANMGIMKIIAIIKSDSNDYVYNDTISKRVEGVTSVYDIAANSILVDTSAFTTVRLQLNIDNLGARGANGFEVGFYLDNDTSTIHKEVYSREQPLPALTSGYYMFDTVLMPRPAGYHNVTGFVRMENDNDPANDTTSVLASYLRDLEFVKLIVEETAQSDCRVFAVLRNVGNLSVLDNAPIQLRAVINGTTIRWSQRKRVEPGQTVKIQFKKTEGMDTVDNNIPKSPTRSYTGSGTLTLGSDMDTSNNMTSFVEVANHVEGVPVVEASLLSLEQNYPNPFTGRTTVGFTLPEGATVRFFIVDAMGHVVNSFSRFFSAGEQTITLDMEAYSSGIYYYGIEVNGERRMKKMILR